MEVSLVKGQKIDLTKTNPGLKKLRLGLGWDPQSSGQSFDLDGFAIILKDDKWVDPKDLVYFGNLTAPGIEHSGDNLTGDGAGDDETIEVTLADLKGNRMYVGANIYQAEQRKQNFGQVKNAYIRIMNAETNEELARYDLSEDYSTNTGVILGCVYNHNGEWKFEAVGQGKNGDLNVIAGSYK